MIEVEALARELATITPEALTIADNNYIKDRAPNFRLFFRQLKRLLCENVPNENHFTSHTEQLTLEGTLPHTSEIRSIRHFITNTKKHPKRD